MVVKKMIKCAVVTSVVLLLLASCVFAGAAMEKYSTTVGRFSGLGYTGYQTKSYSREDGILYSNAVGGKYVVDVRMISSRIIKDDWIKGVNDNRYYSIPSGRHNAGNSVRLQFRNGILTPVNVQAEGKWKSN